MPDYINTLYPKDFYMICNSGSGKTTLLVMHSTIQ